MTAAKQPQPLPPPAKQRSTEPHAGGRGKGGTKQTAAAFQQQRDFVTHWHRELRCAEQTVWHYLWGRAHRDGRMFYVGYDTIAAQTGLNERTVRRCIAGLESHGVLEVDHQPHYHRGIARGYRFPQRLPVP